MASEAFQVVPADTKRHAMEISDLTAKAFAGPGEYFKTREEHLRLLRSPLDSYAPRASRLGFLNGRLVTHCGVWDYTMRIGSARVRVAGLGAVCTHGGYRRRGFMARTIHAALEAARDQGFDLSILFGIPDFYHRFGFVPAWPETVWFMKTEDLPRARPACPAGRYTSASREEMDRLYNRYHGSLTGSAIRPFRHPRRHTPPPRTMIWMRGGGRIAGYVVCRQGSYALEWMESCGDVEQTLRVLGALARRHRCREVRFPHLHFSHPLCRRLRKGNARLERTYIHEGGPMVRVLNVKSALEKMSGELSKRLECSPVMGWSGNLLLECGGETAHLKINRSRVKVTGSIATKHAARCGWALAQLLIGTEDPMVVKDRAGMRLSGDARVLLKSLFPHQHPDLSALDRF